jgi:exodeoxyribonuclease-3
MRVATWNINGLRSRIDFLLHWLRERRPDVVGLQELKLTNEQFPFDIFAGAGYRAVVHGQKAWNGVAVLSREAARETQVGLPDAEDFGARLLAVEVGGLQFATVYCPNGKSVSHEDYPRKLVWFDTLRRYLTDHCNAADPLLVGGDFNICPAPIDSWNEAALAGHIFHTDAERGRFRALVDWGLVDVFRDRRPDTREFSWWDYRGGAFHKKQGLRIDLLLATRPVLDRVQSIEIDREYRKKKDDLTPSDHAPVIVDLQ